MRQVTAVWSIALALLLRAVAPVGMHVTAAVGTPLPAVTMHLAYTYDAANRRIGLTLPDGQIQSWGFDAAGRLTSATYPDGSTEADQYDAGGNRMVIAGSWPPRWRLHCPSRHHALPYTGSSGPVRSLAKGAPA